jgi:phosphoserine aminotransferase
MKPHNFYAGPAILPDTVLQQAGQAVTNFLNTGLSLLEVSHRSKEVVAFMDEAELLVAKLLNLPDNYKVLFLSGGASSQFYMTAMNLLNEKETAGYVDTGSWASKAIKEAKMFGNVDVLASSKESRYNHIPKNYQIPESLKYVHLTSNNTIFGTQYFQWPDTAVPIVCDMSSDIFSKPFPVERFGLIYAGAQKNLGPAGTTLVIVREDMLGTVERSIPTMLDYKTHIAKKSSFNTPPVFPIYVCLLTLRWIDQMGGLNAMEKRNREKAELLYNEIDRNPCFSCPTKNEDRSLMNVAFVAADEKFEAPFLELCKKEQILGLKGHRSSGGFRASIYNAMELESVQHLVNVMRSFAADNAN